MLQRILIGRIPVANAPTPPGVGPFIQFFLCYPNLLLRLLVAGALSLLFYWLGLVILAGLAFVGAEVYASLLLIRALADLLQFEELGRVLTAMWLPVAVVAVAIYLLFVNDQGRELGIGLMDPNYKGLYLSLALLYWAWNNWLSARNGLGRCFQQPQSHQALLFWGPRLLGVCAHLLAAFSLSCAAWKNPDLRQIQEWWLVAAAPAAIAFATAFAWLLDKSYLSQRPGPLARQDARKWMRRIGAIEFILLGGLLYEALKEGPQRGLSLAALWIAGSALLFLIAISILRRKAPLGQNATAAARARDRSDERRLTVLSTSILAGMMFCATLATWLWPMLIGRIFGSLTIACFSFGAFLALVNLVDLLVKLAIDHAQQNGFALRARPVWAVLIGFLVLPALMASWTHSFHRVRLCKGQECASAFANWSALKEPDDRPTVSEAAQDWYAQAEPAYHALHPGEPVPMLIVATAGGGIRAAYWTATILETLERDLAWGRPGRSPTEKPPTASLLRNLLFAISGVSGGSVGAAAYAAAVHDHEARRTTDVQPTSFLQEDFLAPGIASLVFIDGPANLLPDFGQIDRGEALERGFELASHGLSSHKFLSFFPTKDKRRKSWRPALLLNATHQETGRRIITSHIKIERDVFLDSYDALQTLETDVRLSTAAHNSARFTYVSPAGDLISVSEPHRNKGYVIDGGYFENYGAETALELARNAIKAINESEGENKVRLVLLLISSDPTIKRDRIVRVVPPDDKHACAVTTFGDASNKTRPGDDANKTRPRDSANYLLLSKEDGEKGHVVSYANEISAPLVGIMSVREAHGTVAAEELAAESCSGQKSATTFASLENGNSTLPKNHAPHFSHLAMCEKSWKGGDGVNPPLGWVLSDQTRSKFKEILDDCGNAQELPALKKALGAD